MSEQRHNEQPAEPGPDEAQDTGEQESTLEAELAEARNRADEHYNQYLRTVAELDNTRKRAARDVEQAHRYALERIAGELLAVRDSLEMGLAAADGEAEAGQALRDGVEMTLRQLDQVFERFGIEIIDPQGEKFDPERHEAMATVPDPDAGADTVKEVVQKGGILNGRLLRPARVIVTVPRAEPQESGPEGGNEPD